MSRMILQPLAGLANRLRAVASGRVFAETMGYRCEIQWIPNEVECACEAADLFTNLPSLPPEEIDEGAVRFDRADQTSIEDMEAACRSGRPLLVSSFEKFRASSMNESDYNDRLQAELERLEPVSAVRERMEPLPENTVGLQIRRGDHWRSMRYSPVHLFFDVVDRHLREDPATRFFLSTDCAQTTEAFADRYGETVFSYPRKNFRRTDGEGIRDALVDLMTLASTRIIYGSCQSSFPIVAAHFHQRPLVTVALDDAPAGWEDDAEQLQLLTWDARNQRWRPRRFAGIRGALKTLRSMAMLLRTRRLHSNAYQLRRKPRG